MQKNNCTDLLCETTCRFFRCSEKYLLFRRKRDQRVALCKMVEGDECIGYKCKYVICSFRPSALNITTGICSQKVKKQRSHQNQQSRKTPVRDDPLRYREMLDKKMRKNFKIKDFY